MYTHPRCSLWRHCLPDLRSDAGIAIIDSRAGDFGEFVGRIVGIGRRDAVLIRLAQLAAAHPVRRHLNCLRGDKLVLDNYLIPCSQSDAEVRQPFISRAGMIFIPTTYYYNSW